MRALLKHKVVKFFVENAGSDKVTLNHGWGKTGGGKVT